MEKYVEIALAFVMGLISTVLLVILFPLSFVTFTNIDPHCTYQQGLIPGICGTAITPFNNSAFAATILITSLLFLCIKEFFQK